MQNLSSLSDDQLDELLKKGNKSSKSNNISSLSDEELDRMIKEHPSSSLGQNLKQGAKDVLGGLASSFTSAGSLPGMAESLVGDVGKFFGATPPVNVSEQLGQFVQSKINQGLGANPEDWMYTVGKAAPFIYGAGRAIIPSAVRGLKNLYNIVSGNKIKEAEELYNSAGKKILERDYYQTGDIRKAPIGNEQQVIANILQDKYNLFKSLFSQDFTKELAKKGDLNAFGDARIKQFKLLDKYIKGDNGNELSEALNTFRDEPTNNNLHALKTAVGQQMKDYNVLNQSPGDKKALRVLGKVYEGISSHLVDTLGPGYKNAVENWKNYVIPYEKDRVILNAIKGKGGNIEIGNIVNRLKKSTEGMKPEESNAIDKIISHLTPMQKNKVLSSQFKDAVDSDFEVSTDKVLEKLSSLRSEGFKPFLDEDEITNLKTLKDLRSNIQKQKDLQKKVKKYSAGSVAGSGTLLGILHYLNKGSHARGGEDANNI